MALTISKLDCDFCYADGRPGWPVNSETVFVDYEKQLLIEGPKEEVSAYRNITEYIDDFLHEVCNVSCLEDKQLEEMSHDSFVNREAKFLENNVAIC